MSLLKSMVSLIILAPALTSCVPTRIPVHYLMDETISIESDQIKKIAEEVYNLMKDIQPLPVCSDPFAIWLKQKFDTDGMLPKRRISAIEYGVTKADAHKCRLIDIEAELKKALDEAAEGDTVSAKGHIFDGFSDLKKEKEKGGVIEDLFNQDKRKIEILGMNIEIIKNSLNIPTEPYKIYLTAQNSTVDVSMLEEVDAEEKLLRDGQILLLGETQKIPPGFKGSMPVKLVENFFDTEAARQRFVSLESSIIFMPPKFNPNPVTKKMAGQEFFLIPRGSAEIKLSIKLSLGLQLADAWKEWERQKKRIRGELDQ